MNRLRIAVPTGDAAGIGPEVVIKALLHGFGPRIVPIAVGDARLLQRTLEDVGLPGHLRILTDPAAATGGPGTVDVLDVPVTGLPGVIPGKVQAVAGQGAYLFIQRAVQYALAGTVDAIATAPLNKEALHAAGIPYIGHTEILAALTGTNDPLTMFQVRRLRVFFVTRHASLADAIASLTVQRVQTTIERSAQALRDLGIDHPRLALAALNPHGGEHGLLGNEEQRILTPAVHNAQAAGIDVTGPVPADAVFSQALHGSYDAVVSLYHDQGHIATKTVDFERTVSFTLGLPFLRTSVDHGTGFDIAGRMIASSVSMETAIRTAARYAVQYKLRHSGEGG